MSVYAVSDLHGQYKLFLQGIEEIGLKDEDMLWVLGDAIDKGPDGIKLLQHIKSHINMDLLIGNHEYMMLNSLDPEGMPDCIGYESNLWLYGNSGKRTFADYRRLTYEDRYDLLCWLKGRYVIKTISANGKVFCLTHSFYKKSCENKRFSEMEEKEVWSITWSSIWRDDALTKAENIYPNYDYTFICGHVPVQGIRRWQDNADDWNRIESYKKDNIVNIDGGCAYGHTKEVCNGAIFLRLDDMKEFAVPLEAY